MDTMWQGVMPAITTKFNENESLDLKTFEKNLKFQVDAGINGVVLGGSLGEASTLEREEKKELMGVTLDVVKETIPVFMNIAEQSTRNAIKATEEAAEGGMAGIMLLPPMRYFASDDETVQYFKAVAKSTDLPIMIYNNPIDYKINVTMDMFEDILSCDNIEAVKESSRDTTNVTRIKNRFGDRLKIMTGVDTLCLESLALGADGWIAGLINAFPEETVAIYRLQKAGLMDEALAIFRWFLPLLELDIHPKLVQYIKLAETYTGLGTEYMRAPRLKLTGDERARVELIIKSSLKVRPELPDYKSIEIPA